MSRYFKGLIENCIKANEEFKESLDGWIDLDIDHIAEFVGNEVEVMFKNEDDIWITIWNNKPEIVKWMLEGSEIRYKVKPLAPIQITEFETDILWRHACKHGTPCTVKDFNILTKFNGREVIIL